ncbi:hypothetical protein ACFL5L_06815, partial [candidate division KSB1 bacterium]
MPLFVTLAVLSGGLFAQETGTQYESLEKIRLEITRFQKLLAESTDKENSALHDLQLLNQDILLRQKYLTELINTEKRIARDIKSNKKRIEDFTAELETLRQSYKSRALNMYKRGEYD